MRSSMGVLEPEFPEFRAASPWVIACPGLPQIPTCGSAASGWSSHAIHWADKHTVDHTCDKKSLPSLE